MNTHTAGSMNRSHAAVPHSPASGQPALDCVPFAHVFMPMSGIGEGLYLVIAAAVRLVLPKKAS